MTDPAKLIRLALATGGQDAAWNALELALGAAWKASEEVLKLHHGLPPAEQFALALQAADEALTGIGAELAGDEQGEEQPT